jgi:hypothetical protein
VTSFGGGLRLGRRHEKELDALDELLAHVHPILVGRSSLRVGFVGRRAAAVSLNSDPRIVLDPAGLDEGRFDWLGSAGNEHGDSELVPLRRVLLELVVIPGHGAPDAVTIHHAESRTRAALYDN